VSNEIVRDVVAVVYNISLKARLLGEWNRIHRAEREAYSERELFILELIDGFAPLTNRTLATIFGLSPSTMSEALKKLMSDGLIEVIADEDAREKPLRLSDTGQQHLAKIKSHAAERYQYLFRGVEPKKWEPLLPLLRSIDEAARTQVEGTIFRS
jgi:DNA-binding MarR family transcriptional regulator